MNREPPVRRKARLPLKVAEAILAVSDPVDESGWLALLAPDVHLRIANWPVATSRTIAMQQLSLILQQAASIGTGFRAIWPGHDGQTALMELELLALKGCRLPIAIILRVVEPDPVVRDLRIYLDPTPLLLRAGVAKLI